MPQQQLRSIRLARLEAAITVCIGSILLGTAVGWMIGTRMHHEWRVAAIGCLLGGLSSAAFLYRWLRGQNDED